MARKNATLLALDGCKGGITRMAQRSGRHFLQIPGPTNVPDRVLLAMNRPTIDHRGPEFQRLAKAIFAELPQVFGTESPVIIYPSSGTTLPLPLRYTQQTYQTLGTYPAGHRVGHA